MNTSELERHFAKMGARVQVTFRPNSTRSLVRELAIDVRHDRHGAYFDLAFREGSKQRLQVLDIVPAERHLLLMSKKHSSSEQKNKFLCGHDERDWFVAAVPDSRGVSSVRTAMEALKPQSVILEQTRKRVKSKHRNRRRNAAFVRQGEWFFIPCPGLVVNEKFVLKSEPLVRSGGGKPHVAEFAYRTGGETVYVCHQHPEGLTEEKYRRLLARKPSMRKLNWSVMRRNPDLFVRGKIRHSDHKTVRLDVWHQVQMNTENEAPAMRHVVFLD